MTIKHMAVIFSFLLFFFSLSVVRMATVEIYVNVLRLSVSQAVILSTLNEMATKSHCNVCL